MFCFSLTLEAVAAKWNGSSKVPFRTECEAVFKTFSRNVLSLATGLHRSKEVRYVSHGHFLQNENGLTVG
jgi:hypothetical protein